jgi:hypothetical protein
MLMRQRLSATFSVVQKIIPALMLLALLACTGISGKTVNLLPDSTIVVLLFYALLAVGCYALVNWVMKARTIVEFDSDNLYVVRVNSREERAIPLRKLIKLSLRPPKLELGAYWFWTYSLSFTNDAGEQDKIRFMMMVGRSSYPQFLSLVRARNPDFEVKNWTFY